MSSLKQINFDTKKWLDSIKNDKDMCGSYEFCCECNKAEANPCERANERYIKMNKKRRNKAKAKFKVDGKEVNYRATIVE